MSVIRHAIIPHKTEPSNTTTSHPPWPARPPVNGPLFDARFRRHVDHLCRLGPRPVGEFLLQIVGTSDDGRAALIVLLERYGQLDAGVVEAVGGNRWPTTIFPVGP